MSYIQSYYHVVFSTKNRIPCLALEKRKVIFSYMFGTLKNKKCHLYRMNGIDDHVHMLISLHPKLGIADLIRDLKSSCTTWIRKDNIIRDFPGWQDEYAAFTKSHSHRDMVIDYIKNQEEHHKRESYLDELKRLLKEEGIEFDERFLK